MAKLIIDNKEYQVSDGKNLLHACLSLGLNLPYFCWHPCLGSVGACRQCAVKVYQDENDERGRVVMACMTPASEGTRLSVDDPQARDFRAGIIELLMTNHPHDCPVCEEGGECHLQDMTEMTGHTWRTYRNTKRTHRNQNLGPFINHEMNRCIACYRCVRYYQDYAGGHDLQAMGAHNHVYFGRHQDGTLESPFSGNLVEVCPTGVFTDKTFSEHYSRKWDLQTAPSVCQHCGLGCNTAPGERYNRLKRISNRYHSEINGYFLCDRGRFGYGFVNSDQRLYQPQLRQVIDNKNGGDTEQPAIAVGCDKQQALDQLKQYLDAGNCIGIGSPRASLENNFALQQLVGSDNFYSGFSADEETTIHQILRSYRHPATRIASLKTVEECDAIVILGEDITQTAPLLALRLRQAVRQKAKQLADAARIPQWQDAAVRELAQQDKSPLFIAHPTATDLDDIAHTTTPLSPEAIEGWAREIADHILHPKKGTDGSVTADIAKVLVDAEKPLIVAGSSLLKPGLIDAATYLAEALRQQREQPCDIHMVVPECNSLGLALLTESTPPRQLEAALKRLKGQKSQTLVVLENDLYRRETRNTLDHALERVDKLVVIDSLWHDTCAKADLILPAASFAEADGTLVNSECRAQRFFAVYPLAATASCAQASWQWLAPALNQCWQHIDDLSRACAEAHPSLSAIVDVAPDAGYRQAGQKIPRMAHRYSGRTAMNAQNHVSEPQQPGDPDTALGFTMEGSQKDIPPALRASSWAPGWNSNQSIHKFQQEVAGPLTGGPVGVRLLDNADFGHQPTEPPAASASTLPAAKKDRFAPFPCYHIFSSEELSAKAPPIQARAHVSRVALNPGDANALGLSSDDGVAFEIDGSKFQLGIRLHPELPEGLVGLPIGQAGLTPSHMTQPLTITKAQDWRPPVAQDRASLIASDKPAGALFDE